MKHTLALWIVDTFGTAAGLSIAVTLMVLAVVVELAWWILLVYIAARIWKKVSKGK